MPRMDGTGPMDGATLTGMGRFGVCLGNAGMCRGRRNRHGFGRRIGMCRTSSDDTKEMLLKRKAAFQDAITAVEEQ